MKCCRLTSLLPEVALLLLFVLLIRTGPMKTETVINADAVGYYDYLPSLFIFHDFVRKSEPVRSNPGLYRRLEKEGVYVNYKGFKVDKYPVGTALLQWPFFCVAYLATPLDGNSGDGYQKPFQQAILLATLFYLFLGIFFLRKVLELYNIGKPVILLSQFLMVLATPVTVYANQDAGFSHIYSLFALNAFFYFTRSFFTRNRTKDFLWATLFLGLILLLRQINVLAILFVPFLAGSFNNLKKGLQGLFSRPGLLLTGLAVATGVFLIQCLAWYLQTGHFLLYSYQGEGFHFLHPQFVNILFSYKKGLFVYTPVLFFALFGLVLLARRRNYYLVFTWLAFFLFITYVFSSWHSWEYGASYGSRVYIDYYGVFFILFALLINGISGALRAGVILLSVLTVPVNLIQSYQYKTYILHWTNMDKEKYWKVFLKTDKRFEGVLWKKPCDPRRYTVMKKVNVGDITGSAKSKFQFIYKTRSSAIPGFEKVNLIRISFFNRFSENNRAKIIVTIKDAATGKLQYWYDPYLIRFADKRFGQWQKGTLNYYFKPVSDNREKIITVELFSEKKKRNTLKDFEIDFLAERKNRNR